MTKTCGDNGERLPERSYKPQQEPAADVHGIHAETRQLEDSPPSEDFVTEDAAAALISILIVNFNGKHHLARCLPELYKTDRVWFELIIVDNGSTDGSESWLREHYPKVTLICEERNHGFGRANRMAALKARGEFVALLNSDTVVTPDWLWHLLRAFSRHDDVGAVCSTLKLLNFPDLLNARGGGMTRIGLGFDIGFGEPAETPRADAPDRIADVFFPSGAAMLIRRRDFLEQFAFDPTFFMYHEDVDLGWRLWLSGRRVVVSEKSIVHHQFGGTTSSEKGLVWRAAMGAQHNLRSLLKNYERETLVPVLCELFKTWLQQRAYRTITIAVVWNLLHLPGTIRSRRQIQLSRRRPDAELFDRGLILQQAHPAPSPELPYSYEETGTEKELESPILLPGHSSAIGRLGAGWYPAEPRDGEWIRATCGQAWSHLHIGLMQSGTLTIEVMVPDRVERDLEFAIVINGASSTTSIRRGDWQSLSFPAASDEQGRLSILFCSQTWTPAKIFGNGDQRKLGLFVRSIYFSEDCPDKPVDNFKPTVLITTFNRRPVLEETLRALERQSVHGFEVVVVDDGSSDDTWEMLEAKSEAENPTYSLRLLRQNNTGQGIARNNGLGLATGDLIVFLGDDIIPTPNWLAEHLAAQKQTVGPCAVVGFTDWYREGISVTPTMEMVNTEGQQFGYGFMVNGEDVPFTCFYTSNVSVPKQVLGSAPFDARFRTYGWEDLELGYRLSVRGLRIVYNESAKAEHHHQYSLLSFFARQRKVGESVHLLLEKHPQLAACRFMPNFRLPVWFSFGRFLFIPFIPIFSLIDWIGVALPRLLLRRILLFGFLIGEQDGRKQQALKR